ncbi:polysaccharide deacetylase family protein [Thermodesulfobacteriota bacterium]
MRSNTTYRLEILTFHRLIEEDKKYFIPPMAVSLPTFTHLMERLAKTRQVVELGDATDRIRAGEFRGRAVAVTFDDGYRDCFDFAKDTLKRVGIPATFFIPFRQIENGEPFWWDYLFTMVRKDPESFSTWVKGTGMPYAPKRLMTKGASLKEPLELYCQRVVQWANSLNLSKREDFIKGFSTEFGPYDGERKLMNWEEIVQLKKDGFSIGSHAMEHIKLTELNTGQAKAEIQDSREILTRKVGSKIEGFSYPVGGWNKMLSQIVAQAGYSYAVTTRFESNTDKCNLYALARRNISDYQGIRSYFPVVMHLLEITGLLDKVLTKRRSR